MRWWHRMLTAMRPWPRRAERKAEVQKAAAEKQRSQDAAIVARGIKRDIRQLAAENGFADEIIRQIRKGR